MNILHQTPDEAKPIVNKLPQLVSLRFSFVLMTFESKEYTDSMQDKIIRKELLNLLEGYSHMDFDEALEEFPMEFINTKPPNVSYTPYHLLEHIRRTQADLLEYIVSKNYRGKSWPKDYWSPKSARATKAMWQKTIKEYKKDLEKLKKIVTDPKTDLFATVGENPDHTIFREILLAGDHCSYHLGEFASWREIQKTWPKGRRG